MDRRLLALLACLPLAACLEDEETITVREDGSLLVRHRIEADARDAADGHPLPPAGAFALVEAAAERDHVEERLPAGAEGRTQLEARLAAARALPPGGEVSESLQLVFEGAFARAADLPRSFAPASEPYASAFLVRDTRLEVRETPRGRVYAFERTLRERPFERYDAWARLERALGADLFARLERSEPLTDEERASIAEAAERAMRAALLAFAEDALAQDFLRGGAALGAQGAQDVRASVEAAVAEVVRSERLRAVLDAAVPATGAAEDDELAARLLAELDRDAREELRKHYRAAVARHVAPADANALFASLEWLLASHDHTADLGDDEFVLVLRLPGTIVAGNFDERDGDAVRWKVDGADLRDRERVLRAVSLLE